MDTVSHEEITRLLGVPPDWTASWLTFHLARTGPVQNPIEEKVFNTLLGRQAVGSSEPLTLAQLRLRKMRFYTFDAAFAVWTPLGSDRKQFPSFLSNHHIPYLKLDKAERKLLSRPHIDNLFAFQSNYFNAQTLGQLVGGKLVVKQLVEAGLKRIQEDGLYVYRRTEVAEVLSKSGLLFWRTADAWLTEVLRHRRLMFLPEAAALTNTPQQILRRRLDEKRVPYIDSETPRFPAIYLDHLK